ncbi:MAG: alanine/ornithine racemase family PLP-dependent enzyme [Alphaproteobacteria bacterium]|nr:alanine/ornithine racemase family PLP-dependent enzyme [Alphaproteobacteria bacterium]
MATPYLTIDLDAIEANARAVVDLCAEQGIVAAGVTKGVCGHAEVAKAMLRGGVVTIADSRLANLRRLRAAGIGAPMLLLRVPALSAAAEVIEVADISLNSELVVLEALSDAALTRGAVHEVVIMVDLGDLREGVWLDDVVPFVGEALRLPGIRVIGLGTNLACFGGVVPTADNMKQLAVLAGEVETVHDVVLRWISGINSSGFDLIATGAMPARVNHARIGEAILLGRETTHRKPWPGTRQDAFILHAEVLELKTKPSVPVGKRAEDAFGRMPDFEDRGEIVRALLNLGREDVDVAGLTPSERPITILGASSGYLVIDVGEVAADLHVGDEIAFFPSYGSLVAAMTSEYVEKRLLRGGQPVEEGA